MIAADDMLPASAIILLIKVYYGEFKRLKSYVRASNGFNKSNTEPHCCPNQYIDLGKLAFSYVIVDVVRNVSPLQDSDTHVDLYPICKPCYASNPHLGGGALHRTKTP